MAKSKSILRLKGTVGDYTFVNSPTYGDHVRAKRGTHKEAKLNPRMTTESELLQSTNVPAKIFRDSLLPYLDELKNGQLWPRVLSMFNTLLKEAGKFDFANVKPFEIHIKHTFDRFLSVRSTEKFNYKKTSLNIDIHYGDHPEFKKARSTNGYRLRVVVIFPDLIKKSAVCLAVNSNVIELKGKVNPFLVRLAVPPKAKRYIICVKIDGCTNGVVNRMLSTEGMRVIGAGKI